MELKNDGNNIKHEKYSQALIPPGRLEMGNKFTIAIDRLILVDQQTEISEDDILDFLEKLIESSFRKWIRRQQLNRSEECD
jgi:hypothetical protein